VSDELKDCFERGDFLIRNMIGVDPDQGILAIGDRIDVGQTVQFQLRDAVASHEDLTTLLSKRAEELKRPAPAGAVLFSCLGRGKQLYGEPHHDVRMLRELTGSYPVGGFFCNGEIGPISGKTFIHGFTSSIGFFRRRTT
jgi:small ligand-binding sensory domain FIST